MQEAGVFCFTVSLKECLIHIRLLVNICGMSKRTDMRRKLVLHEFRGKRSLFLVERNHSKLYSGGGVGLDLDHWQSWVQNELSIVDSA